MQFKSKVLDNGLKIVGETTSSSLSAAVGFFVKTGSRDESAENSGVSHFLEHMVFKGTENMSALEVNAAFDRTGAQFNAFTSEENTVFFAGVLPEFLEDVTAIWADLMRPSLRTDDFDMEKNVILEEIAMYEDMPQFDVVDKAKELHFSGHPCGNSILGTSESIKNLKAEQMLEYFRRRYSPSNITVCCCGNFNWDKFAAQIEKLCGHWEKVDTKRETTFTEGTAQTKTYTKKNLSREHICMVSPGVSAQDERHYAMNLLSLIIGDEKGSRFYWQLVDTAIAEIASMHFEDMDGVGAVYSYFQCSPENSEKTIQTAKKVLEDVRDQGITEEELDKAKHKALSALTLKNELPMGRLISVAFDSVYLDKYIPTKEQIEKIRAVSVEDVNSAARLFDMVNCSQAVLTPEK
ncbi:M16 family metallopeptidase [Sedimentisphaera salicampi]|uniref:Protease 3 n=1 Tax=Sedimentisphaera salicampi TaxID=1941349 RepID=A0A1W6LMB0_9BACT|nr:pitrilysin family protein [Sedimentisphaera salicampi]ARN56907.1 Protease 3 precursor [Sedimentisphaera salicampi]